jgi:hypothetical protein
MARRDAARFRWTSCAAVMLIGSCHADPFTTPAAHAAGPSGSGNDVTLTFNVEQDYWPAWTEDGRGILYAFVDPAMPNHRCVGLLPAAGGTLTWDLCDNRAIRRDSSSTYGGFALDSTGRLLLTEGVSASRGLLPQPVSTLWLTDTAHPYLRTALATTPLAVEGTQFTWLSQLRWTGPQTFLLLAGQFETFTHCVNLLVGDKVAHQCIATDTSWEIGPSAVLSGALTDRGASLHLVPGSTGASEFSTAQAGATLVFASGSRLLSVPAAGGTPTVVASAGVPIAGVSCKGDSCVYATDSLEVSIDQPSARFFDSDSLTPVGPAQLRKVSLTTGATNVIAAGVMPAVFASPAISPVTGDLVVQVGGNWGRLQTYASYGSGQRILDSGNGVLHLLKGIVP